METEVSLRKQFDGLAESSQYSSAEFWAPPVAQIETSPPADASVSRRVRTLYMDENDPPQLLQHTDLSSSQRSFGSGRKLITGIAVVLTLGLSALAYFFLPAAGEKTTTHTAELAPSVPYPRATPAEAGPGAAPAAATPSTTPAAATPSTAPAAATSSTAPAAATPSAAPAAADSERPPEPVQASPKVSQSRDVLYLQRPGVNIRSTPSLSNAIRNCPLCVMKNCPHARVHDVG